MSGEDDNPTMATSYEDDDSHNDSEEYSDDEDSLEKENDGILSDIKGAWRQHLTAILIAVIAASYFHFFNGSTDASDSLKRFNAYMHDWMTGKPHPHVHLYERTANISFCSHQAGEHDPHPASSLTRFDFVVPRKYIHVMEAHFTADLLELDDYDETVLNAKPKVDSAEYACLRNLEVQSTAPNIKGFLGAIKRHPLHECFLPQNKRLLLHYPLLALPPSLLILAMSLFYFIGTDEEELPTVAD
jgi:hypothetical protein